MNIPLAPLLAAVGGAAIYLLMPVSTSSDMSRRVGELGRLAYFVGMLWLIMAIAGWRSPIG